MELRHNLMMAYGLLLEDLDALGLSIFYRLDLAAVVGRDRVDRVLHARYAQPTSRLRRARRPSNPRIFGAFSLVLLLFVALGLGLLNTAEIATLAKFSLGSPTGQTVRHAGEIPAPSRHLAEGQP